MDAAAVAALVDDRVPRLLAEHGFEGWRCSATQLPSGDVVLRFEHRLSPGVELVLQPAHFDDAEAHVRRFLDLERELEVVRRGAVVRPEVADLLLRMREAASSRDPVAAVARIGWILERMGLLTENEAGWLEDALA